METRQPTERETEQRKRLEHLGFDGTDGRDEWGEEWTEAHPKPPRVDFFRVEVKGEKK